MIKGFFNYLFLFPLYSLLSLITGISKILISYYVLFFKIPFRGLILTPIAKIVDFLKTYKENKIQKSLHQWKENRHDTEKKSLALIKKKDFAATDEYQNTDDIVSVITSFLSIEDLLKVKGTSIQFYSVCHKDLASREIQYAYIIGARPIYTSIFFNFLHRKTITKEELLHSFNSCRIFYTSKLNDAEIEIYKR